MEITIDEQQKLQEVLEYYKNFEFESKRKEIQELEAIINNKNKSENLDEKYLKDYETYIKMNKRFKIIKYLKDKNNKNEQSEKLINQEAKNWEIFEKMIRDKKIKKMRKKDKKNLLEFFNNKENTNYLLELFSKDIYNYFIENGKDKDQNLEYLEEQYTIKYNYNESRLYLINNEISSKINNNNNSSSSFSLLETGTDKNDRPLIDELKSENKENNNEKDEIIRDLLNTSIVSFSFVKKDQEIDFQIIKIVYGENNIEIKYEKLMEIINKYSKIKGENKYADNLLRFWNYINNLIIEVKRNFFYNFNLDLNLELHFKNKNIGRDSLSFNISCKCYFIDSLNNKEIFTDNDILSYTSHSGINLLLGEIEHKIKKENNSNFFETEIVFRDIVPNNHVKYSLNKIIPFANIRYLKILISGFILIVYDENNINENLNLIEYNNRYISIFNSDFNELKKYNIKNEIKEKDIIINIYEINLDNSQKEIKLIIFCNRNLYLFNSNSNSQIKAIKSDCSYLNCIKINDNYLIFGQSGSIVLNNNLELINNNNFLLEMNLSPFDGGSILNKNIFILASSKVKLNNEDKLIFFSSNTFEILREIRKKNFYFSLPSEGVLSFPIQEGIEKYIIICTCIKGIFLTILSLEDNEYQEIFVKIDNFITQILRIRKYNTFISDVLVGGFDTEKQEMRIKIFLTVFNNDNNTLQIELIQEMRFLGFNSNIRINSIFQSKKINGHLLVSCNNGRIYSFHPSLESSFFYKSY